MGYDIVAYFFANQEEIENFIVENNIDREDWSQDKLVVNFFKSKNPQLKDLSIIYQWKSECNLHEFFDCYGTNFIRDDKRFLNRRFMQKLPQCLCDINYNLHCAEDAFEIAEAIDTHFADDYKLIGFAEWLKITAKEGCVYELSC